MTDLTPSNSPPPSNERHTDMLTKNHAQLKAEVDAHIAADAVIQGLYWNGHKGCFIGCLAHSADAKVLQKRFGLPLPLVRLCEHVFERLPEGDATAFFAAIPDAVGRDGKDLTRVHWQFLAAELRALPELPADVQAVIDPVIAGMDTLAAGGAWPEAADAAAAAYTARAAAYAADAAAAAAYTARAAAYAADAAYSIRAAAYAAYSIRAAAYAADAADAVARQRDTILRLIADAE